MKLGWCAPLQDAGLIRDAGFDYIELPLAAQDFAAKIESPLPVGAFNYFFPQDMRIVGPDVDDARLDDYLARAAALMASVSARAAVMGSAWARNVPDGFERARAEEQIVRALDRCADRLQGTGVTLAIEPLYRKESNIINSVAEGVAFRAAREPAGDPRARRLLPHGRGERAARDAARAPRLGRAHPSRRYRPAQSRHRLVRLRPLLRPAAGD